MSRKRPVERVSGSFAAIPHAVLDSAAYASLSYPARALLLEAVRQLNGRNNAHLQLTGTWLKSRGWKSNDVIQRAKAELIAAHLIQLAKQGGLNAGASLYLVTWLPVTDFTRLEISAHTYHPGAWHFADKLPALKITSAVPSGGAVTPVFAPSGGTANPLTAPAGGTKTALLGDVTAPANGNNVLTTIPKGMRTPVVGLAGSSGKQSRFKTASSRTLLNS